MMDGQDQTRRILEFAQASGDVDTSVLQDCLRIGELSREVDLYVDHLLGRHGLSASRFTVLSSLFHAPASQLTPAELAAVAQLTRPAITAAVDGLETIGYVRRLPHPTDRRKILVELTDEGRSFATDRLPKHYRSMVGIAAHLTDRERASLARLYEKVLAGFRTVLDGEGV